MPHSLLRHCSVFCLALFTVAVRASDLGPYAPLRPSWTPPSEQEIGYHKARKLVEVLYHGANPRTEEPVFASTCRQTLVLSDFLDQEELKAQPADFAPPPDLGDLSRPPKNVHEIFQLIRTTVLGRAILKKFFPKYGFEYKVEFASTSDIRSITRNSALALYDPLSRRIKVFQNGELGRAAFVLLHEIVHALDVDYRRAIEKQIRLRKQFEEELQQMVRNTATRRGKSRDQLSQSDFPPEELQRLALMKRVIEQMEDIQIFRAERFAYDASYDVWKELSKRYPKYYRTQPPRFYEDNKIVTLNGLDPSIIDRYKKGQCTPFNPDFFSRTPASNLSLKSPLDLKWEKRRDPVRGRNAPSPYLKR